MTVINVTPGIVRNLLKTPFYLRVPHQDPTRGAKHDRRSETITLPPAVNVTIFWKEFEAVEEELNRLDRENIVRIIQRPAHASDGGIISVEHDLVTVVMPATYLNFIGPYFTVTDQGGGRAGVSLSIPTLTGTVVGNEIPFFVADWVSNEIDVIATGVPAAGQIGPHGLPLVGRQLVVSPFRENGGTGRREIGLNIFTDTATGLVRMRKAPIQDPFDGVVVITEVLP